jgi:hypothetical protein
MFLFYNGTLAHIGLIPVTAEPNSEWVQPAPAGRPWGLGASSAAGRPRARSINKSNLLTVTGLTFSLGLVSFLLWRGMAGGDQVEVIIAAVVALLIAAIALGSALDLQRQVKRADELLVAGRA